MVRYAALLLTLTLACFPPVGKDGPAVRISYGGAYLSPGVAEIQETNKEFRVCQSFIAPGAPVSGVTLWVSRYPKYEERTILVRLLQRGVELRRGECRISAGVLVPAQVYFPPVAVTDTVCFEAFVIGGQPGHSAAISFFSVDNYPGGRLWVGGREVRGDLLFKIHSPDTSGVMVLEGLDLFSVQGRRPSERIHPGMMVSQEFVVPTDSLAGIDFIVGIGGKEAGPSVSWELASTGRRLRQGTVQTVGDNMAQRIGFPLLTGVEGLPLALKLEIKAPWEHEFRFWLCRRPPGLGALVVADRLTDGALVMKTLHLRSSADSSKVIIAADTHPDPISTPPIAGACAVSQEFRWCAPSSSHDMIGIRLAMGGRMLAGKLDFRVEELPGKAILSQGSKSIVGSGGNEFLWFPIGWPHDGGRMRIEVSAKDSRAENAPSFWWSSSDLYEEGEATGCTPSHGGDLIFKTAATYSPIQWMKSTLDSEGDASGGVPIPQMLWLLMLRGFLLLGGLVVILVYVSRDVMGR